jgi:hypothetical protein
MRSTLSLFGHLTTLHESIDVSAPASTLTDASEESRGEAEGRPARELLSDQVYYMWPSVTFGIILAGAIYPVLCGVIVFGMRAMFIATTGGFFEFAVAFISMTPFAFLAAVAGLHWAAIASALTLPLVYLFLRSLKAYGSILWLGPFCGGLIGFVAVLPLMLMATGFDPVDGFAEYAEYAAILAMGPALPTVLDQLGGLWGAKRAIEKSKWYDKTVALATDRQSAAVTELPNEEHVSATVSQPPRLQFGTRHMMWIAVWLSLLLSIIRVSGIPFEFALPLLMGWIVYQAATLYAGWTIGRRLLPWWQGRAQTRST